MLWQCFSSQYLGGIGGHHGSQIYFQWWLALPPTRDHQLSRQPLQGPPEGSLSHTLAVQEFAGAVVAIDEHQNM